MLTERGLILVPLLTIGLSLGRKGSTPSTSLSAAWRSIVSTSSALAGGGLARRPPQPITYDRAQGRTVQHMHPGR